MSARPIQLHIDDAGALSSSAPILNTTLIVTIFFAIAILITVALIHRRTALFIRNEQEAAFRLLSRRLSLSTSQRTLLRSLAQRTSIPPATLLICESAFKSAIHALDKLPNTDRARLLDIQRRIFAND